MGINKSASLQKGIKKLPLVVVLTVPVIAQWLIVVGLISYFSIQNGRQEVNTVAGQLQSEIAALIIDEIEEFLEVPHQINKLNEIEIHREIETGQPVNLEELQHFFWHEIGIFDSVTSVYFGNTEGGLLGAGREGAEGDFYFTQTEGYRKGEFQKFSLDDQGNPVDLLVSFPEFDVRTRPWYTGAVDKQGATWSDVYILSTGQDLAIAASKPIYDSQHELIGVVSVDLFLSHIDRLLEGLEIGKTGQSYIMERNGYLLATSKGGMMYSLDGEVKRIKAQESEDPVIKQSALKLLDQYGDFSKIKETKQTRFSIDGKGYIFQVLPIQDEYGINWLIAVVSPESDFLTHYINNTRSTLTIIVFTLIIIILLNIITARWIIKPLFTLVNATQALADGDLEKSVPINESRIQEIFDLTYSFNKMTVHLRQLVSKLNLEIIERTTAEKALLNSETELKKAQEIAHVGNWSWEPKTDRFKMSEEMYRILGLEQTPKPANIMDTVQTSVHPEDQEQILIAIRSLLAGEIPSPVEFRIIRPDGTHRIAQANTGEIGINDEGQPSTITGIIIDITKQKLAEEKLLFMATHDSLTGLPNRDLFNDRLNHAISLAKRNKRKLAVLFLDLDNFKSVNDAFGHKQGDWLLKLITQRLLSCVRESDTVARIGGDEFIILLEDITSIDDTLPIAEKIIQIVSEPFTLEKSEVFITSSIGISIYPNDGKDPETLLISADQAMYKSKDEGKDSFSYYSTAMRSEVLERLELRNQLRLAIDNKELVLHYQPKVDFSSGKIFAVEALLRWNHPEKGLLAPGRFITLAEESGLIVPITEWVIETACLQLKNWLDKGYPELRMAVNISGRDLNRIDIIPTLERMLEKTGIPPELLVLELTENIVFRSMEKSRAVLESFKELGTRLAIDDFGSGYSTLSQLAHFPFNTLKIDRHFTECITDSDKDLAIVNGIITIANNLGLEVIVEGVENIEQLAIYTKLGCHQFQGWYFSKPLPADQVEPLIKKGIVSFERPE